MEPRDHGSDAQAVQREVNEEPWSVDLEHWVLYVRQIALTSMQEHDAEAYRLQRLHVLFGLPPVLVPLVMTFVSAVMGEWQYDYIVSSCLFLVSGISGALYKWMNLGELYTLHATFAARYYDLAMSIDAEMTRSRRFRRPADVFVTELRLNVQQMKVHAPALGSWQCGCLPFCGATPLIQVFTNEGRPGNGKLKAQMWFESLDFRRKQPDPSVGHGQTKAQDAFLAASAKNRARYDAGFLRYAPQAPPPDAASAQPTPVATEGAGQGVGLLRPLDIV